MPKEWYDHHSAATIEDEKKRELYLSILADRKPYFMRYIYPDLMRQYNTYIKNTEKKAQREFYLSIDELMAKPEHIRSEEEKEFVYHYIRRMPVGTGDCTMNRICRRFEEEFDGYIGRRVSTSDFDYTILKSGAEYSQAQYNAILKLYTEYNRRVQEYSVFASRERVDNDEAAQTLYQMKIDFRNQCDTICSNGRVLCDILLDICYGRSNTKNFVWNICSGEIISNLLEKNDYMISYPVLDEDGEYEFRGKRFSFHTKQIVDWGE